VTDVLSPAVYEQLWKKYADCNSSVYDLIDGDISVYRCKTVIEFRQALARHVNKSILDPLIKVNLVEIKGFLVNWPLDLFKDEDLSPSLATRAIIPNDLWV
jgi:hypothetical protein